MLALVVSSLDGVPDGSGYLKLETPASVAGPEIVRYDPASGKRAVVAGEKLVVPGTSGRTSIANFPLCAL